MPEDEASTPARVRAPRQRRYACRGLAATMLDLLRLLLFYAICPLLWASGAYLFVRSDLSIFKKLGWSGALVLVGAGIGWLVPPTMIESRFLILLAALPLFAVIDVKLARSDRGFSFWLRTCGFELCTVFGTAATVAHVLALSR